MLQFVALENEARAPGTDAALARLSDVIVIQAIRAHLAELPADGDDWLHALADPQVGTALGLIHEHPEVPWTVTRLASHVGLSRSAFAARFTELVGRAPLQYLTYWRMQRAQRLLRAGSAGIAQIAAQVGYQTEPAFSRAFKRWVGVAPGRYRRRGRQAMISEGAVHDVEAYVPESGMGEGAGNGSDHGKAKPPVEVDG